MLANDRDRGDWPGVHPVRLYSCKPCVRTAKAHEQLDQRESNQRTRIGYVQSEKDEAMETMARDYLVTTIGCRRNRQHNPRQGRETRGRVYDTMRLCAW